MKPGRDLCTVPTLTEVVDEEPAAPPAAAAVAAVPVDAASDAEPLPNAAFDAALARLEARLREAVEPALARLADALVRELRGDLAALLREAVEHEAARRRDA